VVGWVGWVGGDKGGYTTRVLKLMTDLSKTLKNYGQPRVETLIVAGWKHPNIKSK